MLFHLIYKRSPPVILTIISVVVPGHENGGFGISFTPSGPFTAGGNVTVTLMIPANASDGWLQDTLEAALVEAFSAAARVAEAADSSRPLIAVTRHELHPGGDGNGFVWSIHFVGTWLQGDQPAIIITQSNLAPFSVAAAAYVCTADREDVTECGLEYTASQRPTQGSGLTGSFVVVLDGNRSVPCPVDASTRDLEACLESIPAVTDVGVTREGPDEANGYTWWVTYRATFQSVYMSGNVTQAVFDVGGVAGRNVRVDWTTAIDGSGLGGSFYVTYAGVPSDELPFDVSGANLARALRRIPSLSPLWGELYDGSALPEELQLSAYRSILSGVGTYAWVVQLPPGRHWDLIGVDGSKLTGREARINAAYISTSNLIRFRLSGCSSGYARAPEGVGCAACGPGKFTPVTGSPACLACPRGSFQAAQDGRTSCERCAPGRFSSEAGMPECKPCVAGRYASVAGRSECAFCPNGKANPAVGSSAPEACISCQEGRFASALPEVQEVRIVASNVTSERQRIILRAEGGVHTAGLAGRYRILFIGTPTPAVHLACLAWRQTSGCSVALGAGREPISDRTCNETIPVDASGYCECSGGRRVAAGCGHPPGFNCYDACGDLMSTGPISVNASGGDITRALESLSILGPGAVNISVAKIFGRDGRILELVVDANFTSKARGRNMDLPTMEVDLVGVSVVPSGESAMPRAQVEVLRNGSVTGGRFRLRYGWASLSGSDVAGLPGWDAADLHFMGSGVTEWIPHDASVS